MEDESVTEYSTQFEQKRIIVKGAFWTYFGHFILVTSSLFTNILLARLLDKDNWGVFSLVLSLVSFFSAFSDVGFNYTIQHKLASSIDKRASAVKRIVGVLLRYKLFLLVLATVILLFLAGTDVLTNLFKVENGTIYFVVGAVFFLFFNIMGTFDSVFLGLKQFRDSSLTLSVYHVLRLFLSSLLVFFGFGISGAIVGFVIALAITTAIQIYFLRSFLTLAGRADESLMNQFSYGFNIGLASMAMNILLYTDSVTIGLLVNATAVGFYRIASGIATAAGGAIGVINKVLFPIFSSESDKKKSTVQFNRSLKYAVIFSIPAFVGLAVVSDVLVGVFFGVQYAESSLPLIILSYSVFDTVFTGILVAYLAAKKHTAIVGQTAAAITIMNVILNVVLINYLGFIGAAVASVFVRIVMFLTLYLWAKAKIGLSIDWSIFKQPIASSAIMLLALILVKTYVPISYSLELVNLVKFSLYVVVGIISYFGPAYVFGFNIFGFGKKAYELLFS